HRTESGRIESGDRLAEIVWPKRVVWSKASCLVEQNRPADSSADSSGRSSGRLLRATPPGDRAIRIGHQVDAESRQEIVGPMVFTPPRSSARLRSTPEAAAHRTAVPTSADGGRHDPCFRARLNPRFGTEG